MSASKQIDDFICERLTEVKCQVSTGTIDIEMLAEFTVFRVCFVPSCSAT